MSKFKVGDVVRIVKGTRGWISRMDEFVGHEGVVTDVLWECSYKLSVGDNYTYYDDSLELLQEATVNVFSKREQLLIEVAKSSGALKVDVHNITHAPVYSKFDSIVGCLVYDGSALWFGGAKCNPADEFDDDFGRDLAFSRAISEVE